MATTAILAGPGDFLPVLFVLIAIASGIINFVKERRVAPNEKLAMPGEEATPTPDSSQRSTRSFRKFPPASSRNLPLLARTAVKGSVVANELTRTKKPNAGDRSARGESTRNVRRNRIEHDKPSSSGISQKANSETSATGTRSPTDTSTVQSRIDILRTTLMAHPKLPIFALWGRPAIVRWRICCGSLAEFATPSCSTKF